VIDQLYQTADDKAKPPDNHVLGDQGVDAIMSLLGKLGTGHGRQGLPDPMSQNNSMDEQVHFQGDPITGHIATVTWNPHRRATLRPHADDM
jgi:cyclic AMP-responsive element-binding protein 3